MPKVVVRGESVYQCNVCNRKLRVPSNRKGLDVLHYCTITAGCKGKLSKVKLTKDIINTPTLTPNVNGLQDWFQRPTLHTHTQVVASNNWVVSHNLQSKPVIHTFLNQVINGITKLVSVPQPITETIDANTTKLIFPQAVTGLAQFVSLASQNVANPAVVFFKEEIVEKVQVSTNTGLITIGTIDPSPLINLSVTYVISGQSPIVITYTDIDNAPVTSSPWAGIQQIFVNGLRYYVRSVDMINHPEAASAFLTGQIPPAGGSFFLTDYNTIAHGAGDVIILGANSPFTSVDRIYDKYFDLGNENSTSANAIYSFGKIYTTTNSIKTIYPQISVV